MGEKELSMFGKIETYTAKTDKHGDILEEHAMMLRVQAEQIKQLQDNGIRLENVVMSENRDTRLTITKTNEELHELIKGLMGYQTGKNQLAHTAKMARMESLAKIISLLLGSGGFLVWLFSKLLE